MKRQKLGLSPGKQFLGRGLVLHLMSMMGHQVDKARIRDLRKNLYIYYFQISGLEVSPTGGSK